MAPPLPALTALRTRHSGSVRPAGVTAISMRVAGEALLAQRSRGTSVAVVSAPANDWLTDFHAGAPAVLEAIYREHFNDVVQAVRRYLAGADAETITHEVFYRLLANEDLRKSFEGGNLAGWLGRVAGNAALDCLRRRKLESGVPASETTSWSSEPVQQSCAEDVEARVLIEQFRNERLPPQWEGVFEARFLRQLPQREAADELGMRRTTLVYQEQRIRALLREFLLGGEEP